MPQPRAYTQRCTDTLDLLTSPGLFAWLATAAEQPHVVPVPVAWHQESVLVALAPAWPTARHLAEDPRVRIGLGDPSDAVLIDAEVSDRHAAAEMGERHPAMLAAYETQTGRQPAADAVFLIIRPRRIQAWRGDCELSDRTLMHDGMWLVQPAHV